jgi:hypothetical protein
VKSKEEHHSSLSLSNLQGIFDQRGGLVSVVLSFDFLWGSG